MPSNGTRLAHFDGTHRLTTALSAHIGLRCTLPPLPRHGCTLHSPTPHVMVHSRFHTRSRSHKEAPSPTSDRQGPTVPRTAQSFSISPQQVTSAPYRAPSLARPAPPRPHPHPPVSLFSKLSTHLRANTITRAHPRRPHALGVDRLRDGSHLLRPPSSELRKGPKEGLRAAS
jgi:hypothetical protein